MRRAVALSMTLALGAGSLAGCTSPASPTWQQTPATSAVATGPGSTFAVCNQLRTAISADLTPLGKALGTLVGLNTAGSSSGVADAQGDAIAAIKKLASDISTTGASAADPALASASQAAAQAIGALATPAFLANLKSVDDVTSATTQLQQAAAPVARACAG